MSRGIQTKSLGEIGGAKPVYKSSPPLLSA